MSEMTDGRAAEVLCALFQTCANNRQMTEADALIHAVSRLRSQPPAEAQERPAKPAECADGCPDQQVCDHCQWPPGPDAEAVGTVLGGEFHYLRVNHGLPDGTMLRTAPPSVPVGVDVAWQEQMADALDSFWNPACGAIQDASYHGPASGSDVVGAIAQGFAAVAASLRESSALSQQPVGEAELRYDAGLLSDYGGGNIEWWQGYIRAELDRAHDFYTGALAQQPATVDGANLEGWYGLPPDVMFTDPTAAQENDDA